jgi:hypothetical protein
VLNNNYIPCSKSCHSIRNLELNNSQFKSQKLWIYMESWMVISTETYVQLNEVGILETNIFMHDSYLVYYLKGTLVQLHVNIKVLCGYSKLVVGEYCRLDVKILKFYTANMLGTLLQSHIEYVPMLVYTKVSFITLFK